MKAVLIYLTLLTLLVSVNTYYLYESQRDNKFKKETIECTSDVDVMRYDTYVYNPTTDKVLTSSMRVYDDKDCLIIEQGE